MEHLRARQVGLWTDHKYGGHEVRRARPSLARGIAETLRRRRLTVGANEEQSCCATAAFLRTSSPAATLDERNATQAIARPAATGTIGMMTDLRRISGAFSGSSS
jgi:hypothetical protein